MKPALIHPFLRRADSLLVSVLLRPHDSSLPTKGSLTGQSLLLYVLRFIPSYEGQTWMVTPLNWENVIHPFLRRAGGKQREQTIKQLDSSLPAKGRRLFLLYLFPCSRFIPSCEGQALSVYAAFSRLKHLVVQFTQMPFLAHPHI